MQFNINNFNIKKKIIQHNLLLSKITFAFYNLIIITILNLFFDSNLAGKLLYVQGIIYIFSALSRFGSDYYWVSSSNENLIIVKYEFFILLSSTMITSCVCYYFLDEKDYSNLFWIFTSLFLINIVNFLGRYYQKKEKHIMSLFMFLLAPSLFVVPILFVYQNINLYVLMTISMLIVIFAIVLIEDWKFDFEIHSETYLQRLNYLPITIYGMVNQNLIATIGGLMAREEQIALLILFQRISGIVLWPQIFHMQKDINKINSSLSSEIFFKNYLLLYIKKYIKEIVIYSALAIIICIALLFKVENFNLYTVIASIIILVASIVNVFLGYLQVQIGHSKNGLKSIIILLVSLLIIAIFINIYNYPYITFAFAFLLFHLMNHISNYYIITRWLKNR